MFALARSGGIRGSHVSGDPVAAEDRPRNDPDAESRTADPDGDIDRDVDPVVLPRRSEGLRTTTQMFVMVMGP
jgi:hypothetical protein